jgi:lipopolysaccharide export system protein LptA
MMKNNNKTYREIIAVISGIGAATLLSGSAMAAEMKSPLSGNGNKEPVEVTSDELEVFQLENRAVFTGHVVAIQGEVRLKADKMTIFYNPPKGDDKPAATKEANVKKEGAKQAQEQAPVAGQKAPAADAVKKIDAVGSVFLSTPDETASGDTGTYDVENNKIYLHDNVVLTRGKNVLRGSHLTYDFTTSRSVMTSKESEKAAGSSDPVPGKGKQRVRALFVPEGNQGVTNNKK